MSCWRRCIASCVLMLAISGLAQSQKPAEEVDQLRKIWYSSSGKKTPADSIRLSAGSKLISEYRKQKNVDSMRIIAQEMMAEGERRGKWLWKASAAFERGISHRRIGGLDSAIYHLRLASRLIEEESHPLKVETYTKLGDFFRTQRQLDSAIYYYHTAIGLIEQYDLIVRGVNNNAYINLSSCYAQKGDHLKALDLLLQGTTVDDPEIQFFSYRNLGNLFDKMGLPERAKSYFLRAAETARRSNQPELQFYIDRTLLGLSSDPQELENYRESVFSYIDTSSIENITVLWIFHDLAKKYIEFGQLDLAAYYINKGLAGAAVLKNKELAIKFSLRKSTLLILQGKHRSSLSLCRRLHSEIEKTPQGKAMAALYSDFSENFEALGRPDSALYYLKKYNTIKDSSDINIAENLIDTYFEHQAEQELKMLELEKQNAEQQAQATLAKTRQNFLVSTILLLFLSAATFFYYTLYKQKKKHSAVLEKEKNKLKRLNSRLRRFSGIVSHDILSNLDLILSAGNVLVGSEAKKERLVQYYDMTQNASHQLKSYCLRLLEEAHTDKGDKPPKAVDPMPIAHAVLARLGPALRKANFRVELSELSPAPLSAALVEQILQNLISNAVRYGAIGREPLLRIAEEPDRGGNTLWVVEDNGPGVPADQRETIFSHQTERRNNGKGQRMGLALLQASLQEQDADIRVEERAGGGARFVVVMK